MILEHAVLHVGSGEGDALFHQPFPAVEHYAWVFG